MKMPVTTILPKRITSFTWEEIAKAGWRILIPVGIAGFGWFLIINDDEQTRWISRLETPKWVITHPAILAPIDLIAVAPVGFAFHLMRQEPPSAERDMAVYLTGAGCLLAVTGIFFVLKRKCLKTWFGYTLFGTAICGAMTVAFYKVDPHAGRLIVPLALWLAYRTAGMAAQIYYNPEA